MRKFGDFLFSVINFKFNEFKRFEFILLEELFNKMDGVDIIDFINYRVRLLF